MAAGPLSAQDAAAAIAAATTKAASGTPVEQKPSEAPADAAPDTAAVDTQALLVESRKIVDSLTAQAADKDVEDFRLAEFKVQADDLVTRVEQATAKTRQRLEQIKGRFAQLGEPPKDGQPPEAAVVTEERNRLLAERNELNAVTAEAAQVVGAAKALSGKITEQRRRLFSETLLKYTDLSAAVFVDAGQAFTAEVHAFNAAVSGWIGFAWKFKKLQLLSAIFLSICAALLFLAGGYRLFGRMINRDLSVENPPYITRLSFAFWSLIVQTASLTAFLIATFFFLVSFNVLRPDVAPIIVAFFGFVWVVFFVARLSGLLFAPQHPNWRLAHVSNRGGRWLYWLVLGMAVINGLDYMLSAISEALNSPVVLTIVKSLIASVLVGLILIGMSFLRPNLAESKDPDEAGRPWARGIPLLMRTMGLSLIFAVLTGYVGLARFASTQFVLTGAMVVTMYIGILSGKAVGKQGSFANTVVGQHFAKRFNLGEVALDQIGLAAGLGIYAVALLFGVPMILLTWGFQIQDIQSAAYRLFTQISIGSINISLVGILGGILLFLLGYIGTNWAQRWIDRNVMARSQVDAGVRNSVKTGIGYLGIGLAVVVGVSAAGIDLSSLALVASALSVGIGFGLQNIVSNFVSGLILLVERPFKVGDHVVTGTTEGIVKRISVRATEIETFRKQSIIVPNSDLINAAVGNWTHRNRIQRSEVPVSVSYDADPKRVIALLLELTAAVPEILRNPEPHVEFLRFGASSLDFELRFHLADMNDGLTVRNNLRAEILKRFRAEGIEMPYPHQDVNIRGTVLTRLEPSASRSPEKASQTDKHDEGEDASPKPA
ncbi:small-conductance mechanosensitive channel [Neorhizobium galegae]|uniref:mechanosensitive ion channel family protein n=1 Tax=Neorhizobium galegae TaxID=399 RepID=UPI001AE43A49|nr:mechanosensitive ion channel family protein [Neorhizobium galegae]MBP2549204.1 small-conductance mechanosensitive channel [Neorhizobium galegae]